MSLHRHFLGAILVAASLSGCASGPEVKRQAYPRYSNSRVFEHPFATVWEGIEAAVRNLKIAERSPRKATALELRKMKERLLQTDWIYTRSRDRYHEYLVNGSPRKQYLQLRVRYRIEAFAVIGGTEVKVESDEEIEVLGDDGEPRGYQRVEETDTSRTKDLLDQINLSVLSAAP